jgi:hypothetical protein
MSPNNPAIKLKRHGSLGRAILMPEYGNLTNLENLAECVGGMKKEANAKRNTRVYVDAKCDSQSD